MTTLYDRSYTPTDPRPVARASKAVSGRVELSTVLRRYTSLRGLGLIINYPLLYTTILTILYK